MTTLDERTVKVVGEPNEHVTHWAMSRNRKDGGWLRLDYPDGDGVRIRVWPLSELTIDEVRRRWGPGEYRAHWLQVDPEAEQGKRNISAGHGTPFALDPIAEPEPPPPPPAAPAMPIGGGDMAAAFQFALQLSQMTQRDADRQLQSLLALSGLGRPTAPADAVPPIVAEMRAEIAQMRAEAAARADREEIERQHREALEIERRRADDAERRAREAETSTPDEPTFDFENSGSIWEAVGQGLIRAAAKNPEQTAAILLPIAARFLPAMPPPPVPQPSQPPPPRPAAPLPPPPPVAAMYPTPSASSEQQTPIGYVAPEPARPAVRIVRAEPSQMPADTVKVMGE